MSLDRRSDSHPSPLARRGGVCRLAILIGLTALAAPAVAQAQTGATLILASEYNMRGRSLSEGRPVLQLRVDHDTASGWYAGGFVSPLSIPGSPARFALMAYGGCARRFGPTMSWDAGLSQAVFAGEGRYNYQEVYGALNGQRGSARLAFSPGYYGVGRTLYFELNRSHALGEGISLSGHVGWLHWLRDEGRPRTRMDLRAAIAAELGDASLQLGLQARQRDPGQRAARARALFASLSYGF
jgi:uncharacterized protein (TIGR02001 family)